MATLHERLRWLRKQHDWTLRDVAARANVSLSYLSEIERGAIPALDILERIADAYDMDVGEILVGVRVVEREP